MDSTPESVPHFLQDEECKKKREKMYINAENSHYFVIL